MAFKIIVFNLTKVLFGEHMFFLNFILNKQIGVQILVFKCKPPLLTMYYIYIYQLKYGCFYQVIALVKS